jgi:hypothetical protein
MPVLRQVTDQRYSATGYGVLNFISCITGGAMIYIGGSMKDAHVNLGRVFQFSAAGLMLSALLLFVVKTAVQSKRRAPVYATIPSE